MFENSEKLSGTIFTRYNYKASLVGGEVDNFSVAGRLLRNLDFAFDAAIVGNSRELVSDVPANREGVAVDEFVNGAFQLVHAPLLGVRHDFLVGVVVVVMPALDQGMEDLGDVARWAFEDVLFSVKREGLLHPVRRGEFQPQNLRRRIQLALLSHVPRR